MTLVSLGAGLGLACSPEGRRLVGTRVDFDAGPRPPTAATGADGGPTPVGIGDAGEPAAAKDARPFEQDVAPATLQDAARADAPADVRFADAARPAGLPVIVTDLFPSQGWFGDADVARAFTPGSSVIRQERSAAGPCATRLANSRGACLAIAYAPPPDLTTAAGAGFVGVVSLPPLDRAHPELVPPARAGDPNWGAEPGRAIPPGATKISFRAAAPTPVAVTFGAGVAKDAFVAPTLRETLGPGWRQLEIALPPAGYGATVLGGFSWALTDTRAAATFYVDDLVWE